MRGTGRLRRLRILARHVHTASGLASARLAAVLAVHFSALAPAAVINVDLNWDSVGDFLHTGSDGVLSTGGAFWNNLSADLASPISSILDEAGNATPVQFEVPSYPDYELFFSPTIFNTLQDTGFEARAPPPPPARIITIAVENLVLGEAYDLAVYVSLGFSKVSVFHAAGTTTKSSVGEPTGFLPGLEDYDYLSFANLQAGEISPGVVGIVIQSFPSPGEVSWIAGFQVRGDFAGSVATNGPAGVTNFVSPDGQHVFPFTNWATAATSIQEAVDAAAPSNLVLVADGFYGAGGGIPVDDAWVLVNKPLHLRSVNGAARTIIDGGSRMRCLRVVSAGALVEGFTLQHGYIGSDSSSLGGGAWLDQGDLMNCLIQSNVVWVGTNATSVISARGGGVYAAAGARLRSCVVRYNRATAEVVPTWEYSPCFPFSSPAIWPGGIYEALGGGIYGGAVENCTVVGNQAQVINGYGFGGLTLRGLGAGVYTSSLENCIVILNYTDNWVTATGSYVCTQPALPGSNNFTTDPQLVSSQDLHLASGSPCRDTGVVRAWMTNAFDLDGLSRTLGGTVSRGAYEQSLGNGLASPVLTAPVYVPTGGTNAFWTTNALISVSGSKPSNTWVVTSLAQGGLSTSGMTQTYASTNWSGQVPSTFVRSNDSRALWFRCSASPTAEVVSAETTCLRVRNSGGGPPAIWITNLLSNAIFSVGSIPVSGSNNLHAVGTFWVSNSANGAAISLGAPFSDPLRWAAPEIALELGSNLLRVSASNLLGAVTSDTRTVMRGGGDAPTLDVTNSPVLLDFGVTNFVVGGSNNLHVVGLLVAGNSASGQSIPFPAPTAQPHRWSTPPLALAPGVNLISVTGTNLYGAAAMDNLAITRAGTDIPTLTVTSMPRLVMFGITNFMVGGSNNPHVVGTMWASNTANGFVTAFAAPSFKPHRWTCPPLSLAPGTNLIVVAGTNALGGFTSAQTTVVRLTNTTVYVSATNSTPVAPYHTLTSAVTTISAAMEEAGESGLVLVDKGTYGSVSLIKAVTVQSLRGPTNTIISGGGSGRCAYLSHSNAILDGFTLTSGYLSGDRGAGALIDRNGVLRNCVVKGNQATTFYWYDPCFPSSPVPGLGGGVYCNNGGTLQGCLVAGNTASGEGGGIYCYSNGAIQNCTFADNQSSTLGGGIYFFRGGSVENSVVYFNTAGQGANVYSLGVTNHVSFTCTTPSVPGSGNMSFDPLFVNRAQSNYRLDLSSPCIDRGTNSDWVAQSVDLDGKPRRLNEIVDLGAYEVPILARIRALLQGAYDPVPHRMTAHLAASNALPAQSPYAADSRTAFQIPSNAVDWVLVQILAPTNFAPLTSQSAFMDRDGYVLADDGSTGVVMDVAFGRQVYLAVGHRNHVTAVSALPLSITGWIIPYDFASSAAAHSGGSNSAVEVESGVWALIAGDADGDGRVTGTDRTIVEQQLGTTGYLAGDLNLDGVVSDAD